MPGRLRVTLRKSPISYTARARGTVRALGLRRIGQVVEMPDNAQTRGMARAVRFLVDVEETDGADAQSKLAASRRSTTPSRTATKKHDEEGE
jgi:large subunit ribosomal protein L30